MKILISDSLSPRGVEVLQQAGYTADVKTKLPKEQLLEEIKNYEFSKDEGKLTMKLIPEIVIRILRKIL